MQNRMHHRDRMRNNITLHVSDNECAIIMEDMKEKGFETYAAYARAALEAYSGKKIFRERDSRKTIRALGKDE